MIDKETIKQIFSIFQPHLYKFYIAIGIITLIAIIIIFCYCKIKRKKH